MNWNTTLWIGMGVMAIAAVLALREHFWLKSAKAAPGVVTELIACSGSKSTTYKPRVRFTAQDGSSHEFVRGYSSSPPGFTVGERVMVAYDASTYEGRILTFGQRFGFAAILGVAGLAAMVLALAFITGRQMMPRIYGEGTEPSRLDLR